MGACASVASKVGKIAAITRDLSVVTAFFPSCPAEQILTSVRGTPCCAAEERASTPREATSANAPLDTSSAATVRPVKVSQHIRRLTEGHTGR